VNNLFIQYRLSETARQLTNAFYARFAAALALTETPH
jgi:hypothetical protein